MQFVTSGTHSSGGISLTTLELYDFLSNYVSHDNYLDSQWILLAKTALDENRAWNNAILSKLAAIFVLLIAIAAGVALIYLSILNLKKTNDDEHPKAEKSWSKWHVVIAIISALCMTLSAIGAVWSAYEAHRAVELQQQVILALPVPCGLP
jgi:cytochrome bd-type quinol oxidase subunit 2